jgi:hypothetical protein
MTRARSNGVHVFAMRRRLPRVVARRRAFDARSQPSSRRPLLKKRSENHDATAATDRGAVDDRSRRRASRRRARAMPSAAIADAVLRVVVLLYPGYLTYKTLEHDRKRADNARGWCVYWVVASAWMAAQPALDRAFGGRAVMYWECKVRR